MGQMSRMRHLKIIFSKKADPLWIDERIKEFMKDDALISRVRHRFPRDQRIVRQIWCEMPDDKADELMKQPPAGNAWLFKEPLIRVKSLDR